MKRYLNYLSISGIVCISVLILASIVWGALGYFYFDDSGEKTEWSVLQTLEVSNRGKVFDEKFRIEKLNVGGKIYLAVGVMPRIGNDATWILLNPESKSGVKQLPKVDYELSLDEFNLISLNKEINPVVLEELKKHVKTKS